MLWQAATDPESSQTIISGMGELHLEIYIERLKREYKVDCEVGQPRVNYRETITRRTEFDYLHKKQSGGSGQYGRVAGYMEPLAGEHVLLHKSCKLDVYSHHRTCRCPEGSPTKFEFENSVVGNAIPPNFIPAVEKGFRCAGGVVGSRLCFAAVGAVSLVRHASHDQGGHQRWPADWAPGGGALPCCCASKRT